VQSHSAPTSILLRPGAAPRSQGAPPPPHTTDKSPLPHDLVNPQQRSKDSNQTQANRYHLCWISSSVSFRMLYEYLLTYLHTAGATTPLQRQPACSTGYSQALTPQLFTSQAFASIEHRGSAPIRRRAAFHFTPRVFLSSLRISNFRRDCQQIIDLTSPNHSKIWQSISCLCI